MKRFERADRIRELPPYLFAEIDRMKSEVAAKGVDIIDLGVGDPDLPTPAPIVERAKAAVGDPTNHRYPSYEGLLPFREAVAHWMEKRFGVTLDPGREVISLIGSKEGIAHLPLAFINPGDLALVPSPGYPVYHVATLFAGGRSHFMPLTRANGFLPDLSSIPEEVWRSARVLFINYPNNPTAAVADQEFFRLVVEYALRHDVIVCHDAAYSELFFEEPQPGSFLAVPGGMEVGVEFHSLSKTFNMTGWRIGWVCGHREVVSALGKVKTNIDSGVFQAVQEAAIAAIREDGSLTEAARGVYRERRDILVNGLRRAGLDVPLPRATFYVWAPVPPGYSSAQFTSLLLSQAGIVTTPGVGFGQAGEGYIRMTLTVATERVREAVDRISRLKF